MIFLYRLEVFNVDGVTSTLAPPTGYDTFTLPNRQLYLLTNYEEPVRFGQTEPFASAFLPRMGNMGIPVNEGWVFKPERIQHDGLRLDDEKAAGQLSVTLPIDHAIAQLYALDAPGVQVWLTLAMLDTTVANAKPLVVWVGQVAGVEYDELRAKLTLDHMQAVLARPGLTAKHPRSCGHMLYDQATCGVKAGAYDYATQYFKYREDGEMLAVSDDGMTVTIPAAANREAGFFENGFLVVAGEYASYGNGVAHYPRGGSADLTTAKTTVNGGYRRAIVAHDGATLTLATPLPPLALADIKQRRVTLFAGCDYTMPTCKGTFNNVARFGGYPYIPIKNPFEAGVKVGVSGKKTT